LAVSSTQTLHARPEVIGRLLSKEVDEGWLIYEPQAGETRLISPLAFFVIELLRAHARPVSMTDIARAVQAEAADLPFPECLSAVEQAAHALTDAGLAISAPLAS
jgi:hypothetical protein